MSLPLPWVDRIFEKLTLTYGREFLNRWDGLSMSDVKTDWAHELSGFENWPEAIAHALSNLPPDRPPSVLQFRDLCRKAPPKALPALPAPQADPERVKSELSKLKTIVGPAKQSGTDRHAWAHRIVARHEAGEPVTVTVLKMARDVVNRNKATPE